MQSQTLWTWEMKRFRTIFLLILYVLVLVFTIIMEYISIRNPGLRLLVNGSTFLMAVVSGVLFWAVLHGGTKEKNGQGDRNRYFAFERLYESAHFGRIVYRGDYRKKAPDAYL